MGVNYRHEGQNLARIQEALKNYYLPALNNQLNIEPCALLANIKKVKCKSDIIKTVAPVGISGGFGFSSEGGNTPDAGGMNYQDFTVRTKDMYANIEISNKSVELAKGGSDSIINALQEEVQGAKDAASWNVGRALFGDGTGKLATVTAISRSSAPYTLTVDSDKNLIEGLIIDIITVSSGGTKTIVDTKLRITNVSHTNSSGYAVTVDKQPTAYDSTSGTVTYITVQGSDGKEITGLGSIIYDSVPSLYGITKASKPIIKPVVKTYSSASDITDTFINDALRRAEREKNSKIDMVICGDTVYDAYVTYLRGNQERVEARTKMLEGGFKAINFTFGNRDIAIVNEKFMPNGEMWGVELGKLEFHQTGWSFMELQGGGIFNLKEDKSVYRATLANYGDLICKNPGGVLRIKSA